MGSSTTKTVYALFAFTTNLLHRCFVICVLQLRKPGQRKVKELAWFISLEQLRLTLSFVLFTAVFIAAWYSV